MAPLEGIALVRGETPFSGSSSVLITKSATNGKQEATTTAYTCNPKPLNLFTRALKQASVALAACAT